MCFEFMDSVCCASRPSGIRIISDRKIEAVLRAVDDDKPTAVRQKLKVLEDIVRYKKGLHSKIRDKVLSLDYLRFRDTMHSLILKDIRSLLQVMESE